MKNFLTVLMILIVAICAGCGGNSYKHISQDEAKKMIAANPEAIILDVRTFDEFSKKRITGALLAPIEDLREGNFSKIPDKDATILVYCRTGRRAEESAQILVDNGYKNVYEIGGFVDWNGPVEGTEIDGYKHISQDEAREMLATNPNAVLIDCRFPKNYEEKHIKGAVFVPKEAVIAENFEKIPDKNTPIICYCGDGNRARQTAKLLVQKGYTDVYEMGGIVDWTGDFE